MARFPHCPRGLAFLRRFLSGLQFIQYAEILRRRVPGVAPAAEVCNVPPIFFTKTPAR